MAGSISSSVLLGWFQSFYGGKGTGTSATLVNAGTGTTSTASTAATTLYAPTPPWQEAEPSQAKLVQQAVGGAQLFNPSAAKLDLAGASADYKNLFALYSGLNSLYALASAATGSNVSSIEQTQLQDAFQNGMTQLQTYLGATSFAKLKLTEGVTGTEQTTTATTPSQASSYSTSALNTTGNSSAVVPAFQGDVQFNVNVQLGSGNTTVPIDLDDMGATPRTIGNVVSFMNSQLQSAGVFVSFASHPTTSPPDTIQVGNQTITVASGTQSWGLTLNTNPAETVSLSAPTTAPAVYVGQIVGSQTSTIGVNGAVVAPDPQSQLLKFDTGGNVTPATTPAYGVPGQIFTQQLGTAVTSVQATATAPDGSVYVLADVDQTPSGATPTGGEDVALMKYDSAGQLQFQTDLGSASSASGLSLAVSADGSQVAVAGQVTGSLTAGQTVTDPTGSNSFVSVFDSEGDQVWNAQDDGVTPNQANSVAFGANGDLYITGQSQTSTVGIGSAAPSNSFLQVFSTSGVQVSNTAIASGGVNTSNGIAVDGNDVYVAGVQNGDAVVTEYDMTNPQAPALVASRDLGNLGGGNVVGVQVQNGTVYVAGSARNGALTNAGAVTSASTGSGLNAFAATLSTGLAPSASDAIAYYGGTGSTKVTAMTVSAGQVYLTGSVSGSLPNEPVIGAEDGFVASLDVGAGTVGYAQRFTGQGGQVAPTSIAVAANGASILDQLGLPQGVVDGPVSTLITANSNVKAGDSFQISTNGESPVTITVQADDTFTSLATEIAQATGYTVNVSTTYAGANGATALEIQPASPATTVRLIDGPTGTDALSELGLKPGLVVDTTSTNGVTKLQGSGEPVYGLGIPASLDLSTAADAKTAQVQIAGALQVVETAYQNLKNAATPAPVLALQKAQAAGKVPAYLSSEIANYQAALTRLTAGQSSTGTTGISALL